MNSFARKGVPLQGKREQLNSVKSTSQPCDSTTPNICELKYPGENLACSSLTLPYLGFGAQAPPTSLPYSLPPPQCKATVAEMCFVGRQGKDCVPFTLRLHHDLRGLI